MQAVRGPHPLARLLGIVLLGCALITTTHAANEDFQAGVAASQRGDYQQAVTYFRSARKAGLDSPALHHNLGVAYYKLGRHDEARRAFRRAAQSPKMRALSHYNLGLVAQAEDDEAAAQEWFRKAREEARTARLRRLAAVQLGLEKQVAPPYTLYVEGFAGYDSNPRLADEDADQFSSRGDESDAAYGGLVAGRHLLAGDWDRGALALGTAYADFHPDLDDENIRSVSGGFGAHHSPGEWRHEYELMANQLWLGGDTLQTGIGPGLRSQRRLTPHLSAELRLRSQYIDGDEDNGYDYLSGWRHELRTRLLGRQGPWRWKARYTFEHNDRDDLRVETDAGTDFFSVSPVRHELAGGVERSLAGPYSGGLLVAFRHSRYRDDEIRAGGEWGERSDDRLEVRLGVSRPLWADWTGRLETTYWDNRSECNSSACDRFEYDRLETLVSVGRSF